MSTAASAASRMVTLAACVGVGSFFVWNLLKKSCGCSQASNEAPEETRGSAFTAMDIVSFWFGKINKNYDEITTVKKWFGGGAEFDAEIRDKFGAFMVQVLEEKQCDDWRSSHFGVLALIVIADQFSRNVYRGTAKMFKYDAYALELCMYAIQHQLDVKLLQLHPAYFQIVLMPLMHSEDLKHHALLAEKLKLCLSKLDEKHPFYRMAQRWGQQVKEHAEILRQCGRYPQRNHLLGRKSTAKELQVMNEKNLWRLVEN